MYQNSPLRRCVSVTPQMLCKAVEVLQMRMLYVNTDLIVNYLRQYYPVEADKGALRKECIEKLQCAVHAGLLAKHGENKYFIPTLLQDANRFEHAITTFWELYKRKKMLRMRDTRLDRTTLDHTDW